MATVRRSFYISRQTALIFGTNKNTPQGINCGLNAHHLDIYNGIIRQNFSNTSFHPSRTAISSCRNGATLNALLLPAVQLERLRQERMPLQVQQRMPWAWCHPPPRLPAEDCHFPHPAPQCHRLSGPLPRLFYS